MDRRAVDLRFDLRRRRWVGARLHLEEIREVGSEAKAQVEPGVLAAVALERDVLEEIVPDDPSPFD